jgi:hypothetical protein
MPLPRVVPNLKVKCASLPHMEKAKTSLLLGLCLLASSLLAQTKQAVSVVHEGNDSVGNRFVYALREEIAKSARYQLFTGDKIKPGSAVVVVEVVSVDASAEQSAGTSSAISVLITLKIHRPIEQQPSCGEEAEMQRSHVVYMVGINKVDQVAKDAIATLDKAME